MLFIQNGLKSYAMGMLLVPAVLSAQAPVVQPLSVVRKDIVFPELTAEQKQALATQAQVILRDLYVHRHHKPKYYPGQSDPGVAIQKVVENAAKMNTRDLEAALADVFARQHDFHLDYFFPAPHGLYISFLPLTFVRTESFANGFEVRLNAINKDLMAQFAPGQRVPEVGDQVIAYNGRSVYKEILDAMPKARGANTYGGFSSVIQEMTVKFHAFRELPASDFVELTLKSGDPMSRCPIYTIKLPWLAKKRVIPSRAASNVSPRPSDRFWLGVNSFQQAFAKFIKDNRLEGASAYPQNPTAEPELTWGRISNSHGNFGYIRLNSFIPATSNTIVIAEIRRLLLGELADTDGLIFDVRNNGGGYIYLADVLPQLFSREDAQVLKFRLLNNGLNYRIYNETSVGEMEPVFLKVVNDANGNGKTFTGQAQLTPSSAANLMGQAYYKPVGVLANARSYSATDSFACSMQDNNAACIFGEDPKTGAGGATVMEHSFFNLIGPADVFQPLPLDHAMRVAWMQAIRFGKHQGRLIEDFGCSADVNASLRAEDLVSGGAGQLEGITEKLKEMAEQYKATVRGEGNVSSICLPKQDASYVVFVKHTPVVDTFINGELQASQKVDAGALELRVPFSLASMASGPDHSLMFAGKDGKGQRLWNLKRSVVLCDQKLTVGEEGWKIDFSAAPSLDPINISNSGGIPAANGWTFVKPYLQVGCNPGYQTNVTSDAILMLDLRAKASARLEFRMECEIEDGWDFMEVYVTDNVARKTLMMATGKKPMENYGFDFSEFAGKDNVSVHFRFISDPVIAERGVQIAEIAIK